MRELIIFCCLLFAGLNAQAFKIYGKAVEVGEGAARVFVDVDKYGKLNTMGVVLSEKALQGLPTHMPMTNYVLNLPSVLNIPPYTHVVLNWNPHGHEPDPVYGLPHFDVHFYFISREIQEAITCAGADHEVCMKAPESGEIPPFYVSTPEGVPTMGWHWLDPRSPEFHGKTFTATYIYGFYNGDMHFLEPMITRDFLLSKKKFEKEVPVPAVVAKKGYYPRAYGTDFDSSKKVHFVILKNFIKKN
ncbi:DUF5602 domain-containing protein [Bdellovibrio bacteriovorus]|uniref:DUF5602 domain-containing protein n=1 Tax=Bdellovibrio TaxID=958 RepID=UPI0035A84FC0